MTVAAVILAATPDSALADADGMPAVRRIADAAWSGGATPIVVVSFDPDGSVAAALAGAPVTLAEPAPNELGPAAQMARGADVARAEVVETDAFLMWPARMTWVGPETVTSLIETHGTVADAMLLPTWEGDTGWPALVPMSLLDRTRTIAPDQMPGDILAALVNSGATERRLGEGHGRTGQRRSDGPIGIEGDDDDRRRPARPGNVRDPSDSRHPVGIGQGRFRRGGKDHRGDGHRGVSAWAPSTSSV